MNAVVDKMNQKKLFQRKRNELRIATQQHMGKMSTTGTKPPGAHAQPGGRCLEEREHEECEQACFWHGLWLIKEWFWLNLQWSDLDSQICCFLFSRVMCDSFFLRPRQSPESHGFMFKVYLVFCLERTQFILSSLCGISCSHFHSCPNCESCLMRLVACCCDVHISSYYMDYMGKVFFYMVC